MDDAEALVTFDPIESWRKGDDVHISYTVARDTKTSTWDWIGLYKVLTLVGLPTLIVYMFKTECGCLNV